MYVIQYKTHWKIVKTTFDKFVIKGFTVEKYVSFQAKLGSLAS